MSCSNNIADIAATGSHISHAITYIYTANPGPSSSQTTDTWKFCVKSTNTSHPSNHHNAAKRSITAMKSDKYHSRLAAASLLLHAFLSVLADRLRFACYTVLLLSSLLLESLKRSTDPEKTKMASDFSLAYSVPKRPLSPCIVDEGVERSMARRKKGEPPMNINKKCSHCEKVFMRPCDLK